MELLELLKDPLSYPKKNKSNNEEEICLLLEIILSVNEASDFNSALSLTLRKVCEATSWIFGEAWLPNKKGDLLEYSSSCHYAFPALEEFKKVSEKTTFAKGVGLPGKVWSLKKTKWVSDLSKAKFFRRASLAKRHKIRAAVAVPILLNAEPIAVLQFFFPEITPKDERWLQIISAIAIQLGSVMQRKRMDESLRRCNEDLEEKVRARTLELSLANEELEQEIFRHKQSQKQLEEKNIALREVLSHIEIEKETLKSEMMSNLDQFIFPLIKKIKKKSKDDDLETLKLLENTLQQMTASFASKVRHQLALLSPKEIEICNMIRNGMNIKDVSKLLNISVRTIDTHRTNIRKKLGLSRQKINLTTHLKQL